ncbi:hypothetical protein PNOK_0905700 [Pyrrhoderma noxium]|uniref:Uncharacterized protein n=1 Tax=Pyrrhoderma noxium TaxID=2282107 RepID=A0A286U6U5_9AGAM|nr:hypothetical protein PNOK_0905700 [Pyrrhoderma noxium]
MDMDGPSTAPSYYIFGALENTNILCLLGSRMFINLVEAGHPNVKNGSGTDDQSGRGSAISDIQFDDPSGPRSANQDSTEFQITDSAVSEIGFADCDEPEIALEK